MLLSQNNQAALMLCHTNEAIYETHKYALKSNAGRYRIQRKITHRAGPLGRLPKFDRLLCNYGISLSTVDEIGGKL